MGKTSLVERYVKGTFTPPTTISTVGASFLTKRTVDIGSGTIVRLQIWDTAGQERFRSISQLYYRGASAVILVYSILDARSFDEMARWLDEVRTHLGDSVIVHVVGTKSDLVAEDPSRRAVPFERCIASVAARLHPAIAASPPSAHGARLSSTPTGVASSFDARHGGLWVSDVGGDDCHEISASSGEGIDEVFRVVTRKLVEQRSRRVEDVRGAGTLTLGQGTAPAASGAEIGDRSLAAASPGLRPGVGDRQRSWLGLSSRSVLGDEAVLVDVADSTRPNGGRCC